MPSVDWEVEDLENDDDDNDVEEEYLDEVEEGVENTEDVDESD